MHSSLLCKPASRHLPSAALSDLLAAMASIIAASAVVAPAAFAAAASSTRSAESTSVKAYSGLKSATLFSAKSQTLSSIQNGSRVQGMQVWTPLNNIRFETLSYLQICKW